MVTEYRVSKVPLIPTIGEMVTEYRVSKVN